MTFGSGAIGRFEEQVVFVKDGAPDEDALVEITEVSEKFLRAKIVEVQKPSLSRVTPPCKVQAQCGGCSWQHLDYQTQLQQKNLIVREMLQRGLAPEILEKTEFKNPIGSPEEMRYRHRIRLKNQNGKWGYFGHQSHVFVPIDDCLIAHPKLVETFRATSAPLLKAKEEPLEFEFALQSDGSVQKYKLPSKNAVFMQANQELNKILTAEVKKIVESKNPKVLYDLYCGDGNFTYPIWQAVKGLVCYGVEGNPASIKKAQAEQLNKNISSKKIHFLNMDVQEFCLRTDFAENAVVILDPPRVGCSEKIMKALADAGIQHLAYVSCNPSTLVRDLKWLAKYSERKLQVKSVQLFDMFPQTEHIETLVELELI